jgi:hypothetical protein
VPMAIVDDKDEVDQINLFIVSLKSHNTCNASVQNISCAIDDLESIQKAKVYSHILQFQ